MDLRLEVHRIGVRRMRVLVYGLPAEANVWRESAFPPAEELLAQVLERMDMWARAHITLAFTKQRAGIPGPVRILRPGEDAAPKRNVVTDPREIAAWFTKHVGKG